MLKLIRHIICESLVKMQHFRQESSAIMYENIQKNTIKAITYSYIWHRTEKGLICHKYVYIYILVSHAKIENICLFILNSK